jgi:hypothetical protein
MARTKQVRPSAAKASKGVAKQTFRPTRIRCDPRQFVRPQAAYVKASKGAAKQTFRRLQSAMLTLRRNGARFQNRHAFVESTLGELQARNHNLVLNVQELKRENAALRLEQISRAERDSQRIRFLQNMNDILSQDNRLIPGLERENAELKKRAPFDPVQVMSHNDVMLNDDEEPFEGEIGFKCPFSLKKIKKIVLLGCTHVVGAEEIDTWWQKCPKNFGKCPKCFVRTSVVFRAA